MSIFLTLVPVYAQSPYFLVPSSHNCTICLCEHTDPQILICGHIFCKACLDYCNKEYKKCVSCSMFITKRHNVKFVNYKEITRYSTMIMKRCDASLLMIDDIENRETNPFCIAYYDLSTKIANNENIEKITKNEKKFNNAEDEQRKEKIVYKNVKLQDLAMVMQNIAKETNKCIYGINDDKGITKSGINIAKNTKSNMNAITDAKNNINVDADDKCRNKNKVGIQIHDWKEMIQTNTRKKIFTWNDLNEKIKQSIEKEAKCDHIQQKTVENKNYDIELDENTCKQQLEAFYKRYSTFTKIKIPENVFVSNNYDFLRVADKILQNFTKLEICKFEENIINLEYDDKTCINTITEKIRKYNLNRRKNDERIKNVFYQSADGQHYYMLPKDVERIINKYKDYDKLPEYILSKVFKIQKELHTYNKYLSHLPINKQIYFCTLCFDL